MVRNISHTEQQIISLICFRLTLGPDCFTNEHAISWCVEIYIEINNYWLAIKFIPLSPELFSLIHLSFLILIDCFFAQRGNLQKPWNFLPVDLHQLLSKLKNSPVMQIRQHMTDSILNMNLSTNSGHKNNNKKPMKRETCPQAFGGGKNLGMPSEVDLCVFLQGLV